MVTCKIDRNVVIIGLITLFIPKGSLTQQQTRCANFVTECISLEECTGLQQQLHQPNTGSKMELYRMVQALHCGFKNGRRMVHFSWVCCTPSDDISREDTSQPSSVVVPKEDTSQPPSVVVPKEDISLLPNEATCGIQFRDRVIGGEKAGLDEHPWVALLIYGKPKGHRRTYGCGGSLISSRYVLTAAHCVVIKKNSSVEMMPLILVRLGEWDTETRIDCNKNKCNKLPIDVAIERSIPHERFEHMVENDIALLRLAQTVQFTDFIKPICLPLTDDLRRAEFDDYVAELASWGANTYEGKRSYVKMKVQLTVINHMQCKILLSRMFKSNNITSNHICAGLEAGKNTCTGDAGSTLMARFPPKDNWVAVGIVSYVLTTKCGSKGLPTVSTRVGAYIKWILSKLEP